MKMTAKIKKEIIDVAANALYDKYCTRGVSNIYKYVMVQGMLTVKLAAHSVQRVLNEDIVASIDTWSAIEAAVISKAINMLEQEYEVRP